MVYRLSYSKTSRDQIKSLHPAVKSQLKTHVHKLKDAPFVGKALERELSGYRSLRTKRFRVIYRIDHRRRVIEIHHVGHRKDVYELFKEFLANR